MFLSERAHRFDLNIRALDCARAAPAKQFRLDPNRKELRVEPAFPRARYIEMTIGQPRFQIHILVH